MKPSSLPIQSSLPLRVQQNRDEMLVEIPNRWIRAALQAGQVPPEELPSAYAPLVQKGAWFVRQVKRSRILNSQLAAGMAIALALILGVPVLRPLILLLLVVGALLLLYQLQSTFIHLSRSRNFFLIYRALFPVLPRRYDDRLSRVTDIGLATPDWVNPANRVVVRLAIHTASRSFAVGEGLNKGECAALVQILRDWCQGTGLDPAIATSPDGERHPRAVEVDEQGVAIGGEADTGKL